MGVLIAGIAIGAIGTIIKQKIHKLENENKKLKADLETRRTME